MELIFYAVHKGRQTGIYPGLEKALYQVKDYPGARWYAFHSYDKARHFVRSGNITTYYDEDYALKAETEGVVMVAA
ncbi:hypothetical protein WALSEDRAFT_60031 [Wallemia mellicola CBS 633.66]|uniref:Ribonuclease H1 N-terminal domain-containing protein n=1 Tax=Wallemia mellicola (strain ATCC MYA-4683 / CBS 633.66) TaxID=671144 RepID=I4YEF9_WALMC|nr:hypothetical protein WALSEDRAFT_60031 [Wallemia mellicola CBS 633.66]EIM22351.1 hypothetical protein WALSEDRAFT_60031 [Wallemia mellicola CBS 633.66]|eukprot:XP_006957606.1 hypothetical protein WALSEDRAFT_60031 [Wallemia mellicola CBS 633.66]